MDQGCPFDGFGFGVGFITIFSWILRSALITPWAPIELVRFADNRGCGSIRTVIPLSVIDRLSFHHITKTDSG